MKTLLTITLTFIYFQVQSQNWIGNQNFIDLFEKSDVVLIGTIAEQTELSKDTSNKSGFRMPLKSFTINNTTVLKGTFDKKLIYYKDIFNGCGYAPILIENLSNRETLIFAIVRNDSIFQIESMNESPKDIANAILEYNKIGASANSKKLTNWFYESSKNNDIFNLLNHNIAFQQGQVYKKLDSINFSIEQRNWFYKKLLSFDNYDYDNEGIISILAKYKDEAYKKILKNYLIKLTNEPYSNVDDLMLNIYVATGNYELKKIIQRFGKDWRENVRKKLIRDFIARI